MEFEEGIYGLSSFIPCAGRFRFLVPYECWLRFVLFFVVFCNLRMWVLIFVPYAYVRIGAAQKLTDLKIK
jgi:hypothetical protein